MLCGSVAEIVPGGAECHRLFISCWTVFLLTLIDSSAVPRAVGCWFDRKEFVPYLLGVRLTPNFSAVSNARKAGLLRK
jgi:hypothetical protein